MIMYFLVRCAMCEVSMYYKKISEMMPEDGAPTASLSFWVIGR
jgi:hypothetical protein